EPFPLRIGQITTTHDPIVTTSPQLVSRSKKRLLALYALAHVPGIAGAIAHSGCYNRTHTLTGFHFEKRSYWDAPDLYQAFSALHFADRLKGPVLIAHGLADVNPSTPPQQAIELYRAIVAAGGHSRLILLPHEGHSFRFRETYEALAREQGDWLRKAEF
ncbi:alpha/beta hydrolase family protein, partial [Nonomuraea sp. NPDC059007]|uniref:alpha/beta hydrolase family protein n=1 Tax=Nonomuraea sp. NPDC059007 TaxID=3346692 RepID=UPI00368E4594